MTYSCQPFGHLELIFEFRTLTRIVDRTLTATERFTKGREQDFRSLVELREVVWIELSELGVITPTGSIRCSS